MKPEAVDTLLRAAFPDGRWQLKDLTGTEDHYELRIASERFVGVSPIAQHRLVYAALQGALDRTSQGVAVTSRPESELIHALALTTLVPSEWEAS
jgi:stress-induced morphogen